VSGDRSSVIQAAVGAHEVEHPLDVLWGSAYPRLAQERLEPPRIFLIGMVEEMDQQQRPLAFEQIAGDLLAIAVLISREIQQIILNLKGRVAISAPMRQGWMKLYQQVFFRTIRR
jgi:hypothetical protein